MVSCDSCGRYIAYADIDAGRAKFHFEPDSHRGPEVNEWTCPRCVDGERKEQERKQ